MLILGLNSSQDKIVVELFEKNRNLMQDTEAIFANASKNKLTFSDMFNEENVKNLENKLTLLDDFKVSISKIKPSQVSSLVRDDFSKVQHEIIVFVNNYQKTVTLYSILYNAYISEDSSSLIPLLEDENYSVTVLANRFLTYLTQKNELFESITSKHCSTEQTMSDIPSTECEYLVSSYIENVDSMQESTTVIRTLFSAYNTTAYGAQNKLIYQNIEDIIQKLAKPEKNDA